MKHKVEQFYEELVTAMQWILLIGIVTSIGLLIYHHMGG